MTQLSLNLLGSPHVAIDGAPIQIVRRKSLAILAYLAETGDVQRRDKLATLFWADSSQEKARGALRRELSSLNHDLGAGWLSADRETVTLSESADVVLDTAGFQTLLANENVNNGDAAREPTADAVVRLTSAVELYRGDFLSGFTLPNCVEFDDWQFYQTEGYRQELASALERLCTLLLEQDKIADAIPFQRRRLSLDPMHEPAHRDLMRLYAQAGQRSAALRQYEECQRILEHELDVPPEATTTDLFESIRLRQYPLPAPLASTVTTNAADDIVPTSAEPEVANDEAEPPMRQDQNRVVTVLAIGMSQPSEAIWELPADEAAALIRQLIDVVVEKTAAYDGVIDHLLTDGAVALFGASQAHEDDPERAVLAALQIRQAIADLAVDVSAGITTGMVHLSGVGLGDRTETTAFGAPVSLATRLQAMAEDGQVLITGTTYHQTRGAVRTSPIALQVRGRTIGSVAPTRIFQVKRVRRSPHKTRGIEGLRAELVGRDEELKRLVSVLRNLTDDEEIGSELEKGRPSRGGQIVSLIGEAGVGKSRLVAELKLAADAGFAPTTNAVWLTGRCLEMTTENAYSLFIGILNQIFGLHADGSREERAMAVRSTLNGLAEDNGLDPQQADIMGPLFGTLLSITYGDEWDNRLSQTDPKQIRYQTLQAIQDLLIATSRRGPMVLVLEDLHWADDLSIDLISLLMDKLAGAPMLLLCVYRPERDHRCRQIATMASRKCLDRYTEIRLRELTTLQGNALVSSLLRRESLPVAVKERILARAQGNPFFIEEIVHSLIGQGRITREGATWQGSPSGEKQSIEQNAGPTIPESVHGVILSRVDRLPSSTRQVLQTAAVLGRIFPSEIVASMMPTTLDTEDALDELADQALIYQERATPEEVYSFRHVLVQEAIYATLTGDLRRDLHAQAGATIEAVFAGNLPQQIDTLAYHYDRSNQDGKAIEYLLQAGEKARRTYLNAVADDYFQRVLLRLESLPASVETDGWRFAVHIGLGKLYAVTSDYQRADSHLRQALEQGKEMGLAISRLAPLYQWLGDLLINWNGHAEDARLLCLEGLELAGAETKSVETAMIEGILGFAYGQIGDFPKKFQVVDRLASYVASLPYQEELSTAYNVVSDGYLEQRESTKATEWVNLALDQFRRTHDLRRIGEMSNGSMATLEGLDYETVIARSRESRTFFAQTGDEKRVNRADCELGIVATWYGRLDLAKSQLEEVVGQAPGLNDEHLPDMLRSLGDVYLARGEIDQSIEILHDVAQRTEGDEGARFSPSEALIPLALAELAAGRRIDAIGHLERALDGMETPDFSTQLRSYQSYSHSLFTDALAGLEIAHDDPQRFRSFCRDFTNRHPEANHTYLTQWMLTPAAPRPLEGPPSLNESFRETLNDAWIWVDPVGDLDCRVADGLEISVPNMRDLWWNYLTAPRLLRPVDGDTVVQTICLPLYEDRPAIGGILLWQDNRNYVRLDRGTRGSGEVSLQGCINNEDLVFGRGTLPSERLWLRLERTGDTVRGLCSADGEDWYGVGAVDFPAETRLQAGLFAAGNIDRTFYHGAYQDGAAIRFESITIW